MRGGAAPTEWPKWGVGGVPVPHGCVFPLQQQHRGDAGGQRGPAFGPHPLRARPLPLQVGLGGAGQSGGGGWSWGGGLVLGGQDPTLLSPGSESNLHRYEVHPLGTFPHGPGPEFKTTVKVRRTGGALGGVRGGPGSPRSPPQVQNFGCYPVQNVTLRMALPALGYRRAPFLSVTRVLADNVSPSPLLGVLGGSLRPPPGAHPSSSPPQGHLHPARPPRGAAAAGHGHGAARAPRGAPARRQAGEQPPDTPPAGAGGVPCHNPRPLVPSP